LADDLARLQRALAERYTIQREVGRGGMATVYLAEDVKHHRPVAIKVLRPELATALGPERFLREIGLTARLNHPHILPVLDSGEAMGFLYYVMPYMEGESLRARLEREKQLPIEDALQISREVADALSHAHRHDVVHRDIKPENILISAGHPVVADFGIAKAISAAGGEKLTETGLAIGTPAYMSPEQAAGSKELDGRSDLYSLGCVLFEMLAGEPPFTGPTAASVIHQHLAVKPAPVTNLRPAVPENVVAALTRALAKTPADRFDSVEKFTEALRLLPPIASAPPARRRSAILWGGAVLVIAAAVVIASTLLLRAPARPPAAVYEQLTNFNGSVADPALSRDGRLLAFIVADPEGKGSQVFLRLLPKGDPVPLTRDTLAKATPAFSLDGSRIAFRAGDREIWAVAALGGEPQILQRNAQTLHWLDDQRVIFSEFKKGIHLALVTGNESGADFRDVYVPPTDVGMVHYSWPSPDGKWVLMTEMDATGLMPCRVVPLSGRSTGVQVGPAGAPCGGGAWSPDSRWIYVSAGTSSGYHLWRQRFPGGSPEQVTFGATAETGVAVAPDGSLIATVGRVQTAIRLYDTGSERQLIAEAFVAFPSFTPDGKALFYLVLSPASRTWQSGELWRVDIASGVRIRLLPGVLTSHYSLSRDGKDIVFTALDARGVSGIWLAPVDRSSAPRQLTSSDEYRPFFGAQGDIIYLGSEGAAKYLFRMHYDGSDRQKIRSDPILYLSNVSPDGEWAIVSVPDVSKAVLALPTRGGAAMLVCQPCSDGWTGTIQGAPPVSWTPDQKYLLLSQQFSGMGTKTFAVALSRGRAFPELPTTGIRSERDVLGLPGVITIPEGNVFPGPSPAVYAFFRVSRQSNLYRIRLPPPE
jgi:eukaryotic-like serine/threonine-protein kinase